MTSTATVPVTALVRSNTELYVRMYPKLNSSCMDGYFKCLEDQKGIYIRCWQDFARGKVAPVPNYLLFPTNGIFYNSSQEKIFTSVIEDGLFDKLIYGNNALILSYGQTGSGKTLTTTGLESTYEDRGILPRIMEKLFVYKERLADKFKICINMRYVETNRNYMMDLLRDDEIIYDMNSYKNIKSTKVKSLYEGLKMIFKAEANKTVRQNAQFNYKSNMGNTIVTLSIYTRRHHTAVSEGTLHVVDLAGIDTIGNTSCSHKNGYEVGNGNLAKSQIEQLVHLINENFSKTAEFKQRLCIIIHYLRKTLNANSLIRVIAHMRVSREDLKICTSMLRLGCSFKGMVPKKLTRFLETSIDVQYSMVVDELKALKREIDLNAMLCDEDMSYNLSDERLDFIKRLAKEYLEGDKSELVMLSTTDTVIVMKTIKAIYRKIHDDKKSLTRIKSDSSDLKRRSSSSHRGYDGKSSKKHSTHSVASQEIKVKTSKAPKKAVSTTNKTKVEMRSNFSGHSMKSRTTTKTGKKKRRSSSETSRDQIISMSSPSIKLPEEIPSFTTAWNKFKNESGGKFAEIEMNQKMFDSDLEIMTKQYNKEVLALEQLKSIANTRRQELSHAIKIKDIESNPHTMADITELQDNCTELCKMADRHVLEQKEKLLTLQAEMQLHMDYRTKLQDELNKKFDEFCLKRFNVLVPDITDESKNLRGFDLGKTDESIEGEDPLLGAKHSETVSVPNECMQSILSMNHERFDKLKAYMKRELARVLRRKVQNRKWMMSFNM